MSTYDPKYKWRRTKIDDNDVPTDNDWSGVDGEIDVGRIQKQPHGPMKGKWLWSAHGPRVAKRLLPHQGYEAQGREAMRKVEDYYDRLLAANGLRPCV
ncbi:MULTISPECIES: hypothetical protein [unclassified Rhizobium]|uniref:hypothetical protein n=1 Tax=unclassified Rhizobium TaxID=2613769 RepID=UPI00146E5FEF|nr:MULTISPECIES: hypothetical protein [unclassified Rhizobium]MBD9445741.1 hypothetical protein [Rhizobium sp. RHZ01]NMN73840.1 hypothetical protein [Rhizobium sp. 57MFTsu3.2]